MAQYAQKQTSNAIYNYESGAKSKGYERVINSRSFGKSLIAL